MIESPKKILTLIILSSLSFCFNSQICGHKKPNNFTDCIYDSYEDQACCFIDYNNTEITNNTIDIDKNITNSNNKSQKGCLFIPHNSTFITPYINYLDFGLSYLFHISIDCGKNEEKDKRICKNNPIIKNDCFEKSNSTHDCCYFQSPNKSICLWNDVKSRKNSIIFGTNITCYDELSSIYYTKEKYSFIKFLFILIFFII